MFQYPCQNTLFQVFHCQYPCRNTEIIVFCFQLSCSLILVRVFLHQNPCDNFSCCESLCLCNCYAVITKIMWLFHCTLMHKILCTAYPPNINNIVKRRRSILFILNDCIGKILSLTLFIFTSLISCYMYTLCSFCLSPAFRRRQLYRRLENRYFLAPHHAAAGGVPHLCHPPDSRKFHLHVVGNPGRTGEAI